MSVTTMTAMINPEVMASMINEKLEAQLKLTKYAKVNKKLVGVPGDTVTIPCWGYIGPAYDVAEGEEVTADEMSTSKKQFTIKKAMKCIKLTQESINSGYGDPKGSAARQLAKAIKDKVEIDVLDAAYSASMVFDGTSAAIGYMGIVDAVTKFQDEESGIDKVMFIHPAQEAQLLKDSNFLSADKFEKGVAVNGAIGKIAGCWIKKSLRVKLVKFEKDNTSGTITIVSDSTTETSTAKHLRTIQPNCTAVLAVGDKVKAASVNYYACPIIKLEADSSETEYTEDELPALTIFLKKDTSFDDEWLPKPQRHDLTVAKYYGVALTNEAKVVVADFKATA